MVSTLLKGNWDGYAWSMACLSFPKSSWDERAIEGQDLGLVHRIDKDTSGLLVDSPKSEDTMTHLAAQFFHHTSSETYMAFVWGELERRFSTIRGNVVEALMIEKWWMSLGWELMAKHAVTHWKVVESCAMSPWSNVNLETGRTHQILRNEIYWHPLFNDAIYEEIKIRERNSVFENTRRLCHNCFWFDSKTGATCQGLGLLFTDHKEAIYFESTISCRFWSSLNKWAENMSCTN